MAKRGRGFGRTHFWALCLVVLAVAGAIGLARYGSQIPVIGSIIESGQKPDTVVQDVRGLNELATAEMPAQVVVPKEESVRILGQQLPDSLVGQKVLLVARGKVEAGINLDELDNDDVRVDGNKVTIHLPKAHILEVSLNEDKTRPYDWYRGLLIKGDYTLVEDARREAVDWIEAAARDEDIVKKAQNNADDSIREFLMSLGYKKVMLTDR